MCIPRMSKMKDVKLVVTPIWARIFAFQSLSQLAHSGCIAMADYERLYLLGLLISLRKARD